MAKNILSLKQIKNIKDQISIRKNNCFEDIQKIRGIKDYEHLNGKIIVNCESEEFDMNCTRQKFHINLCQLTEESKPWTYPFIYNLAIKEIENYKNDKWLPESMLSFDNANETKLYLDSWFKRNKIDRDHYS